MFGGQLDAPFLPMKGDDYARVETGEEYEWYHGEEDEGNSELNFIRFSVDKCWLPTEDTVLFCVFMDDFQGVEIQTGIDYPNKPNQRNG